MSNISGGFHLIGSAMDAWVPLATAISATFRIERPNEEQMKLLHQGLDWFDPRDYARQRFETISTRETRTDGSGVIHRTGLPEKELRYLLLTFHGTGNDARFLFIAAQLVVSAIWSLFHIYTKEPFGIGGWALLFRLRARGCVRGRFRYSIGWLM